MILRMGGWCAGGVAGGHSHAKYMYSAASLPLQISLLTCVLPLRSRRKRRFLTANRCRRVFQALDIVLEHWSAPLSSDASTAIQHAAQERGASKATVTAIGAAFDPANVRATATALMAPARAHQLHDALETTAGQQCVLVNGHKIRVGGDAPPFLAADFGLLQVHARAHARRLASSSRRPEQQGTAQALEERDGNVEGTAEVLDGVEFVGIEPDALTAEFRTDALMAACAFLGTMRQQPRSDVEVPCSSVELSYSSPPAATTPCAPNAFMCVRSSSYSMSVRSTRSLILARAATRPTAPVRLS